MRLGKIRKDNRMSDEITKQPDNSVASMRLLASDHEALILKFCAYRDALDYCLSVLKSHHMTKAGISTLVRKTEIIKANKVISGNDN